MKKLILVFVLVLGAGLFGAPPLMDKEALAIAGCCKERATTNHAWRKSNLSFKRCKDRNAARDGDKVFNQSGKVWWDVRC